MDVRDFDTALWLHNKLGASNDPWSARTIVFQLSQEKLRNIRDCYADLQPQVKLKLLLSILHISRRNVEEWKNELQDIIDIAINDSDRWVSSVADLLSEYPNSIQISLESNDLVEELVESLSLLDIDSSLLPLECMYLNKNAMLNLVGQLPAAEKHFTLIRKPKSAAIRAELIQKYQRASQEMNK